MKTSPFKFELKKIDKSCIIYMVNIDEISDELKKEIDDRLVSICMPNTVFQFRSIKKALLNFLKSKNTTPGKASNITMGIISEFFNHLLLNNQGFKQEFQFFNLEEGSMKKGFDGVYFFDKKYWLLESKSSGLDTSTHKSNIKTAHTDLKNKISGNVKNNPWLNAFNHIRAIRSTNRSLIKKIQELSENYINNKYDDISNYNIIPCSTIIMEKGWCEINIEENISGIKEKLPNMNYQKLIVVCINKKSLTHFANYLRN